jgi:hypothetical protein
MLPLNPSVVLLLGGGVGVYIIGRTIDTSSKENQNANPTQPVGDDKKTQGLLTDILSDEHGVSIHRLQAVAFNVIYGIGFVGCFVQSIKATHYPFVQYEQ